MSSESVCISGGKTSCLKEIPFKNVPNQSRLFLEFQAASENVRKFYPERFSESYAEKVLANYKTDRDNLSKVLEETNRIYGATDKTLENIELLRQADCVAVVTGQQAGLFTGALYTIYKALSAVKFAENLRAKNIKAVPVFWIAEEDHDFDEVKKTFVINRTGDLATIENTPKELTQNSPVGFVNLDITIEETKNDLFNALQHTEVSHKLQDYLSESYMEGESYSTAFAKFLTRVFGKYGLIIFSPLNEKLKELSSPIFVEAIKKSDEIRSSLLARTKELTDEKYHAQVLVENDFFPFFILEGDKRFALKKNAQGKYHAKGTKLEFSLDELIEIAENEPQRLSSNALMRSIVQDFILPTATYFGGAAEIAYFAQNAEIYRILDRPVTPIQHRSSFTIVESKNRRTLEKYDLNLEKLFIGKEEIFAGVVNDFLANKTAKEFVVTEEIINMQLNRLDQSLSHSEPTLSHNLATRRRKILYHIGALMKKFQRSEIQKDESVRRRLEFLFASLLPHKALQERSLNVTYFLNLYGESFIDWVYNSVDAEEKHHQILYL